MEIFEIEPLDTSLGFSILEGNTLTFIYIFLTNFISWNLNILWFSFFSGKECLQTKRVLMLGGAIIWVEIIKNALHDGY